MSKDPAYAVAYAYGRLSVTVEVFLNDGLTREQLAERLADIERELTEATR
ncbi:hypothetical protein EV193_104398 [Herbihabitans rhizosphaerae]|uniref:Uncharacterized protein n=1 Tax=Herbihabitans rhizosphaerae TaxID=1872711 RepID=A0A4Q7KUL6_9PSEU|nr:hypothetical protein [Herbihabitans rhizosphaerae]RZS39182.1 hypothetical protein EV193_104398 [Herbihabitans rhizosphaerae]